MIMNEHKLQQLFASARKEATVTARPGFASHVLQAVRHEAQLPPRTTFDELADFVPHLALAAAAILMLCLAADLLLGHFAPMDLASGVDSISEQWLFAVR